MLQLNFQPVVILVHCSSHYSVVLSVTSLVKLVAIMDEKIILLQGIFFTHRGAETAKVCYWNWRYEEAQKIQIP